MIGFGQTVDRVRQLSRLRVSVVVEAEYGSDVQNHVIVRVHITSSEWTVLGHQTHPEEQLQ